MGWVEAFILNLPNFIVAVLVVVVAWMAARLVRKLVLKLTDRISSYREVNRLLASTGYIGVLLVGIFVALGILKLDTALTSLLAGAGIIGLALGFAFQDIISNFVSGVILSVRRPFAEGDHLETNGYTGVVEKINLRATELRTFQGQRVIIPNKDVFQNALVNFSVDGRRRIDLAVGVAYGDDLETARQVALDAVDGLEGRDPDRPVQLFFEAFGSSSIDFVLQIWIRFGAQRDFLEARSEAIIRVKKAFDDNGITIPFPIRTLDFGVVGGEKLSEVLAGSAPWRGNGDA
jgi:small conductance mechanosensitive channel